MDGGTVPCTGGKRQLPQWMIASAADRIKGKVKTDHVDNNNDNNITEEKTVTQRLGRLKNRKIKDKKEAVPEKSSTQLLRCQATKRSRRKLTLPNDDCNDESCLMERKCDRVTVNGDGALPMLRRQKQKTKNSEIEGGDAIEESTKGRDKSVLGKRKCGRMKDNSNEAGPSLRRQKQKAMNSRNENYADAEESTPKTDEDLTVEDLMSIAEEYADDADEDLTVEDLMSIAEEYVNEDEEAASVKDKSVPMEDAISVSIDSLSCIEVDNQFLRREETNTNRFSIQETRTEDAPPPELINMTENPTQNMLDVFLGPLLKRTHEKKSIELVRQEMKAAHDLNSAKNQSDTSRVHPELLVEKKKRSLKDKIALFLD